MVGVDYSGISYRGLYRFLVDAKIYEVESKIKDAKDKCLAVETVVIAEWGLKPPRAN